MTPCAPALPAPRRIVLVAGPSGSGKGLLATRSGLPTIGLDDFYRDADAPGLPRRFGIPDWDDPASWDAGAALEALTALAHDGTAEIPDYSISHSRRLGMRRVQIGDAPIIVAEGIFATELVEPLRRAGLLADALVLRRPVPLVFALRLARDLRESRKPPLTLLERGLALAREQRGDVARWAAAGMTPLPLRPAVARVRQIAQLAACERRIGRRSDAAAGAVLRITAVCFLRAGADGRSQLLCVRKRGTGSYMQVGGKLEPGESPVEAALREVEEEIGCRLEAADLAPLGEFEAVAANEPGTRVRSTVYVTEHPLPDPLAVRAELADHRWIGVDEDVHGVRIAPLMVESILPALREREARRA